MAKPALLIVDDDRDVALMLANLLQTLGLDAECAFDGLQAAGKIEQHKPDLILMDFRMPGGSGSTLYEQLQASPTTKDVPVIFVSGATLQEVQAKIPSSSRVRFLKKPIDMRLLRRYISELLPAADIA